MRRCGVTQFYKVDMEADGWGLLVNEGTAEAPRFRVVLKGPERWMERVAADLSGGGLRIADCGLRSSELVVRQAKDGERKPEVQRHD